MWLFILFVPYNTEILPPLGKYLLPLSEGFTAWLKHALGLSWVRDSQIYSDSGGMQLLLLAFVPVSSLGTILLCCFARNYDVAAALRSVASYFLSYHLMSYGLAKVFKHQFYLPEPNTLFTPIGQLEKDILYWTTMGVSRSYSLFLGGVEVLVSLLLLHKKTRFLGGLLAAITFVQVLAINVCFEIDVKLLSGFLLLLSLVIVAPDWRIFQVLWGGGYASTALPQIVSPFWKRSLHALVVLFILVEPLSAYFRAQNFNDDAAMRPHWQGAYQVICVDGGTSVLGDMQQLKRVFIHRKQYLIFQNKNDSLWDFELEMGHLSPKIQVKSSPDLRLTFEEKPDSLFLNWRENAQTHRLCLQRLNWKNLPVFR